MKLFTPRQSVLFFVQFLENNIYQHGRLCVCRTSRFCGLRRAYFSGKRYNFVLTCRRSASDKQHSIEKLCDCIICTDIVIFHATNSHFHIAQSRFLAAQSHFHAAEALIGAAAQNKDPYRRATYVGSFEVFVSSRMSHYACWSPFS
jgi:hypothetical protein